MTDTGPTGPQSETKDVPSWAYFEMNYELFESLDMFNAEFPPGEPYDAQRWLYEWRCW